MTTAITSSSTEHKGYHGGNSGVHGLHLLSAVVDTYTGVNQQVIGYQQSTFPEKTPLAFSAPSDIPNIKNCTYGRLLADIDFLTKSGRSFPTAAMRSPSLQEKGRGAGKLKSHIPVRISHPTKVSAYRSAVVATRSQIGPHFVQPVTKALNITRPELVLPSSSDNMATSSSSSESDAMAQTLSQIHQKRFLEGRPSLHSQTQIQMLPQFYQHHRRSLPMASTTVGGILSSNQRRELPQGPTEKEAANVSIKHGYSNIITRCDYNLNGNDIKNNIKIDDAATATASIMAEKVPVTAFMANGKRVMTKQCTVELNYIKHKAVPTREKWMGRFSEIVEFKKKYGHTKVPHNFPDSPKLAEWQKFQRQQRKLFVKGKHSQLTPERVIMLEKIGFVWEARIDAWESHYVNLRRFKESNGHIYVPVASTVLSQWVKRQRKQYKKYENGQDSSLTSDRVERLNRLGFIWDGRHLTE